MRCPPTPAFWGWESGFREEKGKHRREEERRGEERKGEERRGEERRGEERRRKERKGYRMPVWKEEEEHDSLSWISFEGSNVIHLEPRAYVDVPPLTAEAPSIHRLPPERGHTPLQRPVDGDFSLPWLEQGTPETTRGSPLALSIHILWLLTLGSDVRLGVVDCVHELGKDDWRVPMSNEASPVGRGGVEGHLPAALA
jgi:hypothetical protein